ncbi:trace amine-associated receptor 13c-like [Syngnathoides biaculeatus]|uniref:trace amine-associated receptor 13c-like n=1 Tax=Syngnathoides biaculeatus TaxID=300417 RepID=UPI002ADDA642|nr:trace amine-associated receptor 13c-like [Syngnathoides biaculeatus]
MDNRSVKTEGLLCSCFSMDTGDQSDLCFPQQANTSCRKPSSDRSEGVLFSVLLSAECVLTVLLNLLVIISISHFRQLHTPTNLLLLSLAFSDFLVGLVGVPGSVYMRISCWFLGDIACSLWSYTTFVAASSSVGNMVFISADRYVAICDPLHYNVKVTVKRIQLCVCLSWVAALLHCGIILNDHLSHPRMYNSCHGQCVIGFEVYAGILDLVVNFVLPLSIIITLYMRVFVVAVSQARAMRSHVKCVKLQHSAPFRAKSSELKAARTIGVLVLVFLVCFCPYYIVSLMADNDKFGSGKKFVIYLYDVNSCVNPLIYALFYPWFRKAVKHIVTLRILQPSSREANIL